MISCRFDQTVPFARDDVFAWHERPGVLQRLTPPFMAEVAAEATRGIRDGSRVEIRLLGVPPPFNTWVAEHFGYSPPESFADRAVKGPLPNWVHHHRFDELTDATRVRDEITFDLPRALPGPLGTVGEPLVQAQIRRMFAYRHRQLLDDLTFAAARPASPLRVAMSGSTGLIGRELSAFLRALGHDVVPMVRTQRARAGIVAWDPGTGWVDEKALAMVDAVIHLAGKPIGSRFTERHTREIRESRVGPTAAIARAMASMQGPRVLVSASGIGYYGADRPGRVSEDDPPGDDFLARVCVDWEHATAPAVQAGIRVVTVRTGIVLTPRGGALAQQLPLFRLGLGGHLGDGRAWQSWVSIDDVVGIYAHALLRDISGPVNAVAPVPVTSAEFAATLGAVLHRPAAIPVPEFGPKLLLGAHGADQLAFANQRVSSARIEATGYEFRQPYLTEAFRHVLGVPARGE